MNDQIKTHLSKPDDQKKKPEPLSVAQKAKRALCSQGVPETWAALLTDQQTQDLAATVDHAGCTTPMTAPAVAAVRQAIYDSQKVAVDDDSSATPDPPKKPTAKKPDDKK